MPFTVSDFHDLVRILEERPEWRGELRRLVLTDELLSLPEQVASLRTTTDQRFQELSQQLTILTQQVTELTEAQKRTEVRLAELAQAQAHTDIQIADLTQSIRPLSSTLSMGGALKAERQVCKLRRTLGPKEVSNAVYPCHSDAADCKVRALVFPAGVGTRAGIGGGRLARPGQAHRDGRGAGHGAEPGRAVPGVPSRVESGAVVESGGGPRAVGIRGACLRFRRHGRDWDRRDAGAAAGREDQGQRDLSRSRALRAVSYGKGQGVALALGDAAQRDSVGGAGLGLTVFDCGVSLGALSSAAGATPQAVAAVGGATDRTAAPVGTGSRGSRGSR